MIYGLFSYITFFGLVYWVMKYDLLGAIGLAVILSICWWVSGVLIYILTFFKKAYDKILRKLDYYFYKRGLEE